MDIASIFIDVDFGFSYYGCFVSFSEMIYN